MMVCVEYGGCHTEIATGFSSPRNDDDWLSTTVSHTEIATNCKSNSRNDEPIITMTVWGYCHCEQSEAIHKPLVANIRIEKKKNYMNE